MYTCYKFSRFNDISR